MTRLKERTLSLMSVAIFGMAPVSAGDGRIPRILVDATSETPRSEIVILLVNQPLKRSRDFKCAVDYLVPVDAHGNRDPERNATGKVPHSGALIVLKPGQYDIGVLYQTHLREGHIFGKGTYEAGKSYAVNCTGKTFNQMDVRSTELEQ